MCVGRIFHWSAHYSFSTFNPLSLILYFIFCSNDQNNNEDNCSCFCLVFVTPSSFVAVHISMVTVQDAIEIYMQNRASIFYYVHCIAALLDWLHDIINWLRQHLLLLLPLFFQVVDGITKSVKSVCNCDDDKSCERTAAVDWWASIDVSSNITASRFCSSFRVQLLIKQRSTFTIKHQLLTRQ